jgi:hypothetical protein
MACGEYGCDDGCCGNAQCLPSAKRAADEALVKEAIHFGQFSDDMLRAHGLVRTVREALFRIFHETTPEVTCNFGFVEQWERQQFEDSTYTFYLQQREKRAAAGRPVMNDTPEPTTRELMFARNPVGGDYLVWAYQAAWSGWKMARGGA